MVPPALRLPALALALLLAAFALVWLPSAGGQASGESAAARPALDPAAGAVPATRLRATATLARGADRPGAAPQRLRARAAAPVTTARRVPPKPLTWATVRIRPGRSVRLRAAPGGAVVASVGATTEFGSRRVLAIAERRGRWLGVLATERPNGRLGWIDGRSGALDRGRTRVSLRADLSARRIDLRVGRRVVERLDVAVGRSGSSTPTGRFAVTDKLSGGRFGPYYGCCILALSGKQPNLPAGWRGGNRLAVHGTNSPGTIGMASSAGCLRASDRDLRTLMRRVPVGAQIVIRR